MIIVRPNGGLARTIYRTHLLLFGDKSSSVTQHCCAVVAVADAIEKYGLGRSLWICFLTRHLLQEHCQAHRHGRHE